MVSHQLNCGVVPAMLLWMHFTEELPMPTNIYDYLDKYGEAILKAVSLKDCIVWYGVPFAKWYYSTHRYGNTVSNTKV